MLQPQLLEAGLGVDVAADVRILVERPGHEEPELVVGGEGEELQRVPRSRRSPVDAELRVVVAGRDGEPHVPFRHDSA